MITHHVNNFTVKVNPAIGINDLQVELEKSNQFIPLGPFSTDVKIDDIIEFNLIGGFVELFGQPKDWIINAEISTSTGDVETGADVVKNVSGYNLTRFIAGSRGKIGKLRKVTFRTLPIRKKINVEPCKILNGFRIVLLPDKIQDIEKLLLKQPCNIQIFAKNGIVDIELFQEFKLEKIIPKIEKWYVLKNGVPFPLNENNSEYHKLIEKLTENVPTH